MWLDLGNCKLHQLARIIPSTLVLKPGINFSGSAFKLGE